MCPFGGAAFGGDGPPWRKTEILCHCLLIEGSDGLTLVETGFGTADVADPKRLGRMFCALLKPDLREEYTAIAGIRALGFDPADVRHVLVTHLDVDHAGGLGDFPTAEVHVHATELEAALKPSLRDRERYRKPHWEHGPKWKTYSSGGDDWFGFEGIRVVAGSDPEVLLIPLPGHSRGHCGIAVRDGDGWLLHAGDAYFHHGEMRPEPNCPGGLRFFQNVVGHDRKARLANQERLRELVATRADRVDVFCAHDPHDFARWL